MEQSAYFSLAERRSSSCCSCSPSLPPKPWGRGCLKSERCHSNQGMKIIRLKDSVSPIWVHLVAVLGKKTSSGGVGVNKESALGKPLLCLSGEPDAVVSGGLSIQCLYRAHLQKRTAPHYCKGCSLPLFHTRCFVMHRYSHHHSLLSSIQPPLSLKINSLGLRFHPVHPLKCSLIYLTGKSHEWMP